MGQGNKMDHTVVVNLISEHLTPYQWVWFRRWARLDKAYWNTPLQVTDMEKFISGIREAVVELYQWQNGGTNFTSMLYTLIQKADPRNQERISLAYPDEVVAFLMWQGSENEAEFFKSILADKSWRGKHEPEGENKKDCVRH